MEINVIYANDVIYAPLQAKAECRWQAPVPMQARAERSPADLGSPCEGAAPLRRATIRHQCHLCSEVIYAGAARGGSHACTLVDALNLGPGAKLTAGTLHLRVGPAFDIRDCEIGQKRVGGDELGPGQMP